MGVGLEEDPREGSTEEWPWADTCITERGQQGSRKGTGGHRRPRTVGLGEEFAFILDTMGNRWG